MKTLWLLTWRGMKKRKAGTLLLGGACCGVLMFTGSYIQQTGIAYTTAPWPCPPCSSPSWPWWAFRR